MSFGRNINFLLVLFSISFVLNQSLAQTNENGYNIFYFPSGKKLSEGNLKSGKPEGYWKTYYENGHVKSEGNRKNFVLDSIWKFYNDKGLITSEINYKDGKKNGVHRVYNEKGKLQSEEFFINNVRQGKAVYYYETGEVKKQMQFDNNIETGTSYEFDKDGRIITIEEFKGGRSVESENINRFDENGKKTGKWVEYYDKNKIKSEVFYTAGTLDGVFKEYDKDGNLKQLKQYDNGEINDTVQEFVFIDIRTEYYDNGQQHLVGGYANNKKQGIFREYDRDSGKIINSFIYEQDVKMSEGIIDNYGIYKGKWKIFYKTGELKEEGEYIDGIKEGEWKYYYTNGVIEQKGKYVKGKIHGSWSWYYANSKKHREETYRYGKEEGVITEFDSLGNIITQGEFIGGLKDGEWFYDLGDHIEKGKYSGGDRDGEWEYRFKDNDKLAFKGKYKNGLAEGKHVYYYKNGKVEMEGKYKGGLKHGAWSKFDDDGTLNFIITYKNGVETAYDGERIKRGGEHTQVNTKFE